jgi:site-specific DNA-methyltransferase (adenine-specific)
VQLADAGKGSAARFFKSCPIDEADYACFKYCAKASKAERNIGLDGEEVAVGDGRQKAIDNPFQRGKTPRRNTHPTVKPLSLMRYLVRLVTPLGGTVLDPFAGSGTTIMAAVQEGFNGIGIEQDADHVEIALCRVEAVRKVEQQLNIFMGG